MLPKHLTQITSTLLKNTPYTFNILWNKGPYLLLEMKEKYPKIKNLSQDNTNKKQFLFEDPCTFGKISKS